MGLSIWLYLFLFFIMKLQSAYCSTKAFSYSPPPQHPHNHFMCKYEQSLALLQFKKEFSIDSSIFASRSCGYYGQSSKPKTMSWNMSVDCCKWEGVTCDGLTGDVIGLDLSCSQLKGTIHSNSTLFQLSHLKTLNLAFNDFYPSEISHLFGQFASLTHLNLSRSHFYGNVPSEISHLSNLVSLDLSYLSSSKLETNDFERLLQNITQLRKISLSYVDISLAIFPVNLSPSLTLLDLSHTSLHGNSPNQALHLPNMQILILHLSSNPPTSAIPSSLCNITQFAGLGLSSISLTGPIPSSVGNLTQLAHLDLSNYSLTGSVTSNAVGLQNLIYLYLNTNSLNGTAPSSLFAHLSLLYLDLESNRFSGPPEEFQNHSVLVKIYFSYNQLHGYSPHSLSKLVPLKHLDLSRNNLTGIVELNKFSNLKDLTELDHRQNNLQGQLPFNICNLTSLQILDLSHNNLGGEIPPCLGNFSYQLSVLNLQKNNFRGTIQTTFAKSNNFRNINFNGNKLEGKLPRSLANCSLLEVLDLGNNQLTDKFPAWLRTLPKLKVLVLKSNRFQGSIPEIAKTESPFSNLHIIDISNNEFSGLLPSTYFTNFKAMMKVEHTTEPKYMGDDYYKASVTVVLKGIERELVRILTIFTTIDMSNNKFEGEIPNFIGNLGSLRGLNLSHNKFVGSIPPSLGELVVLESLDLSFNQFEGEIPQLLTGLTSLEVLNLSQNHLEGHIPRGKQFNTFDNSSYSGNVALCGFPLSKDCGGDETLHQLLQPKFQEGDDSDFESGFTWKVVCLGYGCGTIFGLVMGFLMFSTGKPKWLTRLVENYEYKNGRMRGRQRRNRRRN